MRLNHKTSTLLCGLVWLSSCWKKTTTIIEKCWFLRHNYVVITLYSSIYEKYCLNIWGVKTSIYEVDDVDSCNEWPKTFSQSGAFKNHLRIHLGEKPHHCNQCPKDFSQSFNLKKHLKVHTGEKPFPCNQCPKAFSRSSNLKTHLRIHSGEKAFTWKQCSKAFILSGEKPYHFKWWKTISLQSMS